MKVKVPVLRALQLLVNHGYKCEFYELLKKIVNQSYLSLTRKKQFMNSSILLKNKMNLCLLVK